MKIYWLALFIGLQTKSNDLYTIAIIEKCALKFLLKTPARKQLPSLNILSLCAHTLTTYSQFVIEKFTLKNHFALFNASA